MLNPVEIVVQGRCTSVKRVLTPRPCDRYMLVWSQVRTAVVKWSTGCVCPGHASAGRKFEPRECPELRAVGGSRGAREWVVAISSLGATWPYRGTSVAVLNPVEIVVQGRCPSVKRVLTPRSWDRYTNHLVGAVTDHSLLIASCSSLFCRPWTIHYSESRLNHGGFYRKQAR